jgi:hypothetical protein
MRATGPAYVGKPLAPTSENRGSLGGMTWTSPTPAEIADGPLTGDDRPILEAFLAWQRHSLLNICAGLTADQLAQRPVPPSNLSLLGLVRHMGKVERTWLRQRVAAELVPSMFEPSAGKDADFEQAAAAGAQGDFARYDEEVRRCDAAAAGAGFDQTFELRGETYSVRLVYVHLIAEYARHNGHADLLRQRLDGVTGR